MKIIWTNYFLFRVKLRKYDLKKVEHILKYSSERYYDTKTNRKVVIGKHNKKLVIIPYDIDINGNIIPVTIHAIERKQINFRLKEGRFKII